MIYIYNSSIYDHCYYMIMKILWIVKIIKIIDYLIRNKKNNESWMNCIIKIKIKIKKK